MAHSTLSAEENRPSYVVGLGASAGGLEALRALFGGLRQVRRLSFVVVQHLAPLHRSRLVELIAHETTLDVREIVDGEEPRPGIVYVTPPNADVVVEEQRLYLRPPAFKIGPKPSVDRFLSTLASEYGERAIAIILSGTGSDGAHGVRAVKAAGGLTLCQAPEGAKYDGMPRAALQTGAVDLTASVENIGGELQRFDGDDAPHPLQLTDFDPVNDEPFARILAILGRETGVDLHDYKQSTVRRRIERRLIASGRNTIEDYADFIAHHAAEAELLLADILISVTAFFRDAPAFDALAQQLDDRIKTAAPGAQFRCWVAGCATGEEVYSIAILIRAAMDRHEKRLRVQLFATDLDEQALLIARRGIYSRASLVEMPQYLVDKYFHPLEDRLQVAPEIRDLVVFAKHNLISDPPFLGLDLVACRNVLIYFNATLQERVLRIFHYSMHAYGMLFLGRSETAHHPTGCFEPIDKHIKLFTKVRSATGLQPPQMRFRREAQREAELASRDREEGQGPDLFQAMIRAIAPHAVLVDEALQVRQVFGNGGDYLRLPPGEATTAVTKLVPAAMAAELTTLLHRAARSGRAIRGQRHELATQAEARFLQLQVIPIDVTGRREFIVGFDESEGAAVQRPLEAAPATASAEERAQHLETELKSARESLQLAVEEHETANEELQALNEELQSANEELQSTNEELETANEELQSSNEELTTLNQELNVKSSELLILNQRLAAIQSAIAYPLLVLDRELRLVDFNQAARHLFRVGDGDLGSGIRLVPAWLDIRDIANEVEQALIDEKDRNLTFEAQSRHFEVRVQLYHDHNRCVAGCVVSFVETTELRSALAEAEFHRRQISAITENTPALITMKDSQGVYQYANSRFCEETGHALDDVIGRTDEELFGPAEGSAMREQDFEVLKTRRPSQVQEVLQLQSMRRWWLSARFPLLDAQNRAHSICTVSQDVTAEVVQQRELSVFRQLLSDATDGIVICEASGSDPSRAVYCSGKLVHDCGLHAGMALDGLFTALLARVDALDQDQLRAELTENGSATLTFSGPGAADAVWICLRVRQLAAADHGPAYLVMLLDDVTDQVLNEKILQEQKDALGRFSRLASLGEVAAGISHEINTPLNAIGAKTELLRRLLRRDDAEPARVDKLTRDIDRMVENIGEVIAGLKSLVRSAARGERERVSLRRLLQDTLRIVGLQTRRRGVALHLEVEPDDMELWCNPVQIGQILVNLINNGVDAVSGEPDAWVKLRVRSGSLRSDQECGDPDRSDRECIVIDVIDGGQGIPAEIAEKVMTPFFTTKDPDKGTGLGLSLSRSIARRHGGELELRRGEPNTTFRLTLPTQAAGAEEEVV